MSNDTTPLQERIARAIHLDDLRAGEAEPWGADEYLTAWYRRNAAAVLPIIAAEVQAAAEHRIARLEAQTDIRGRAVVIYRERAREAEARIKAVRALHTGTRWPSAFCDACDQPSPCPTIRALDGDA